MTLNERACARAPTHAFGVATSGYAAVRSARELCEEEIAKAHGSRTLMNSKLQDDLIDLQFSIAKLAE
jgi:hypothetical protein